MITGNTPNLLGTRPSAWPLRAHLIFVALASAAAMWLIVAGFAIAVQRAIHLEEVEGSRGDIERTRSLLAKRAVRDRDRVVEYGMWDMSYRHMAAKPLPDGPTWFHTNFELWFPEHYGDRLLGLWNRDGQRRYLSDPDSTTALLAWIERSDLFQWLGKQRSLAGLVWVGGKPYLVGASVVLPAAIGTDTVTPRGYLVAAQPLNDSLLDAFSFELQQRVTVEPLSVAAGAAQSASRVYAGGDSAETRFVVNDIAGRPAGVVVLQSSRMPFRRLEIWVPRFLSAAAVVAVILLGIVWLGGDRLIVHPLVAFTAELDAMQRDGQLRTLPPPGSSREWSRLGSAFNRTVERLREVEEARDGAISAHDAKAAFLANMSHEIRTPMNGVLGMLELLLESELEPDQRDRAQTAQRSAQSLLTIIDDILDFSKIEAGKLELDAVDFDPRQVVEEIAVLFGDQASRKGLDLSAMVGDDMPPLLHGDAGRLRQILLNLAGNALKFTESGEIVLRALVVERPGESVVIRFEVRDTGIGMSPEVRERLFLPFSQADASTTRRYGGTGLGLAISKQLVELMGGELNVESAPGLGSVFWFTAAFAPGTSIAPAGEGRNGLQELRLPDPAAASPHRRLRLLLAEDNEVNQQVALGLLERFGHQVDVVGNGAEAVVAAGHVAYDLILMDCQMPEMDGYGATREIRRRDGGRRLVPIVAMTASAMKGDRERCLAAGMDDHVAKPISRERLEQVLIRWATGTAAAEPPFPPPARVPEPASATGPAPLDLDRLREISGDDGAKARRFLAMFVTSSETILKDLEAALVARAEADAAQVAHKLKGVCVTIGADEMAALSLGLEGILRERRWIEAEHVHAELRGALGRAVAVSAGI